MVRKPTVKEALHEEYKQLGSDYARLEDALKSDLKLCFEQAGIQVLSIESRIKEFESFWRKVQRERCDDPLENIRDICGLRVICYYPSHLYQVCDVIKHDFEVIEFEDKADSLKTEEFGYRSFHIIVAPAEHSLRTPRYRGLDALKAEIQVRTIFAHAWAELSHELDYKKEEHAPKPFRRTLHQLGAMLENLDDQFDELRQRKVSYVMEVSREAEAAGEFDVSQELNIDTLQAFLDFHLPHTPAGESQRTDVLGTLQWNGITLQRLQAAHDRIGGEEEILKLAPLAPIPQDELTQPILAAMILDLTDDDWWHNRSRVGRLGPYRRWVGETRQSLEDRTP
jgi:putative GTP pyrophosphokinase